MFKLSSNRKQLSGMNWAYRRNALNVSEEQLLRLVESKNVGQIIITFRAHRAHTIKSENQTYYLN